MTERSRTVLIALGVSLLVVTIVPLLVCLGGMAGMGGMGDMGTMMGDSGGTMMSGKSMITGGLVFLAALVTGVVSLVLGLRRS